MGRTVNKATDEMMQGGAPVVALGPDDAMCDQQLAQAREIVATLDADDNFAPGSTGAEVKLVTAIKDAMTSAVDAIEACRKLQKRARRDFAGTFNVQVAQIDKGATQVRLTAQGSRVEIDDAAERYRQTAIDALRASVAERFAPDAEKLGAAAADACVAAQKAVKRARLAYAYRSTSTGPKTLEDALARERFAVEIKNRGVAHLFKTYSAMLDVGDDEQLAQLEDAAEEWLREVIATPAQRLAQKNINGRVDSEVQQEQSRALTLLAEFQKRREARIPRGVRIAAEVMDTLVTSAWAGVVGVRAWDLSRDEMDRLLRVDGAKPFETFTVRDGWHMRLVAGRASRPGPSQEARSGGDAFVVPQARVVPAR